MPPILLKTVKNLDGTSKVVFALSQTDLDNQVAAVKLELALPGPDITNASHGNQTFETYKKKKGL